MAGWFFYIYKQYPIKKQPGNSKKPQYAMRTTCASL